MSSNPDTYYCPRCLNTFDGDREQCANLGCGRPRPAAGWGRILAPGEVFDRNYQIHRLLAVGGAGVTYLAREIGPDGAEIGPQLAIKVLLAARDQGPYLRRLANEAHIIQELDHPNIVEYLGFVHRAGHSPYLITRFEQGGSLLDHMRRSGMLSIRLAAGIARQICWALEEAHSRGIIHRDLKPENVLLTRLFSPDEEPVIRVADFGIAKVQGSLGSNLTRVGAFVGTPLYAAPEQFIGGRISKGVDTYGVGALVHFLLTGQHVVQFADRLDPADTFQLLVDHLPPVVSLDHEDSTDVARLNSIFAVTMAPEPRQRCTIVQLDEMLGALLAGRDPTIPEPVREVDTGPLPPAGSVVGMAGALEGLVSSALSPEPAPPPAAQGDDPLAQDASPEPTHVASPTLSLDPHTVEEAIGVPPAKRRGRRLFVLLLLLVMLGLGLLGAGGLVVWGYPELLSRARSPVAELDRNASDAVARRDYADIQGSLDHLHDWLAQRCDVANGQTVRLEIVIEGDGSVRSAQAIDESPDDTDRCIARYVRKARFTRAGDDAVRVRMGLAW